MRIGGWQPLTLIDYPGKIAAIIFMQGCNLRCGYCHNPQLVDLKQSIPLIQEDWVLKSLSKRQGLLQGVVISGGEATLQEGLDVFLRGIKDMGYAIKLDTNGTQPKVIRKLLALGLLDYIAMDIKTTPSKYQGIFSPKCQQERLLESIDLIRHSGIDYEFRTTAVKAYCSNEDLSQIQQLLQPQDPYRIQRFKYAGSVLDQAIVESTHYTDTEMMFIEQQFQHLSVH